MGMRNVLRFSNSYTAYRGLQSAITAGLHPTQHPGKFQGQWGYGLEAQVGRAVISSCSRTGSILHGQMEQDNPGQWGGG